MANFTTNIAFDFSIPGMFFVAGPSSVLLATSSMIRLQAPNGSYQEYTGSFNYTYSGDYQYLSWPGSTLTGLTSYSSSWVLQGSATGLNIPGTTYEFFGNNNDLAGLKAFAFRENDSFIGSAYNDVLWGYAGNDTLAGGAGSDTLVGGADNDTYVVQDVGDVVAENLNEGTDTVQSSIRYTLGANVENLTLTGNVSINGTGNSSANALTGNSGNNVLNGGADNDLLNGGLGNDTLNGSVGADTMIGGLGNDTFVVDSTLDVVTEASSAGTDLVKSTATHTLSASVEKLTLLGSANLNGTGNTGHNVLTGNSGKNVLTGNSGNDTLNGGLGSDTLNGGAGADIYLFNSAPGAANIDQVTGYSVADDTIRLENAIFTSLTSTGTLSIANFRAGPGRTAAADGNDFIIYNTTTGELFYDAGGTGGAPSKHFVTLVGHPAGLTASDFFIT